MKAIGYLFSESFDTWWPFKPVPSLVRMNATVEFFRENLKIVRIVISFITIYVMNNLVIFKCASNNSFHNYNVHIPESSPIRVPFSRTASGFAEYLNISIIINNSCSYWFEIVFDSPCFQCFRSFSFGNFGSCFSTPVSISFYSNVWIVISFPSNIHSFSKGFGVTAPLPEYCVTGY